MSTFIQMIWMKVDLVFKKFSVKIFDNISKIQTHLYLIYIPKKWKLAAWSLKLHA